MTDETQEITDWLLAWSDGDQNALEHLMPMVERELRRMARRYFERENSNHTLQPTALVNELYLRLLGRRSVQWKNRAHFFGFSAQMMRRILVDHARIRRAEKRGDGLRNLSLEEVSDVSLQHNPDLVALDDALKTLAAFDPRQARVVELRYFAGLDNEEIAEVLGISTRTVKREWRTARLWLHQELSQGSPEVTGDSDDPGEAL
jgi:RNA polymerase sigma factor (TIGR02999 family)